MKRNSRLIAAVLVTAVALAGSANAQRVQDQVTELREEVAQLRERLARLESNADAAALLAVHGHLVAAGFHAMDDAIANGEIDPRFLNTVDDSIIVVGAVHWPAELEGAATAFTDAASALSAALRAEDQPAAAEAAASVHDLEHQLTHGILGYLGGGTGHDDDAARIPEGAIELALELDERGGAVGGSATHAVSRGSIVALRLSSGAAGELHLHGYDLEWHLEAGQGVVATFEATSVGRFPFEFHPGDASRGIVVGYLEVRP